MIWVSPPLATCRPSRTTTPTARRFRVGEHEATVLHVPGPQPGLVCAVHFEADRVLFAGDTLFAGSVGRTDLPGGDTAALVRSIREVLFPLGDEVRVRCGHGPSTTLGEERRENPFVGERAAGGRIPALTSLTPSRGETSLRD